MLDKILDFCESIIGTVISGVFLVLSLVLSGFSINLPINPAVISVIISGLPMLCSAAGKLIKNKGISKISSALLISVAMIAAIAIGDIFAAGEVAFIMAIGEILEDFTTGRAKRGLKNLISLTPTKARRITDSGEETIDASEILIGDIIRVLPGEAIAVDGVVIKGESSVDQSVMTGESVPVDKTVDDEVYCGTINRFGVIEIKATKVGEDSSLGRLIRMVKDAEKNKAPMAKTVDKAASWLVPAAFLVAVLTGIITRDITRAVTVLVVFCPCALVLATPTAIMAAIGQATKHGVIIKSGEALEKMGKADIVAFDKTGTLTCGQLSVSDIIPFNNTSSEELLALAASAESLSEHPLGKAIVRFARENNSEEYKTDKFVMSAGKGVEALLGCDTILCGNDSFLADKDILLNSEENDRAAALREQGKATVVVAKNGEIIGIIALSDTLREGSLDAVCRLHEMNTDTVLLTGDNHLAAEYFGKMLGVNRTLSELLPEDKVSSIEEMRAAGKTVCMIGDGVNDAPALKTADVGVAMGSMGSDIAIEAADIALMSDDISKIPYLKRLSNATLKTIKLSIAMSMIINFAAVSLSVLGLLGTTAGALVHNAGSCFVVLFAALLYDRKFR